MNGNLLDQPAYEPPVGKLRPNWLFTHRRATGHPRQFNGPAKADRGGRRLAGKPQ